MKKILIKLISGFAVVVLISSCSKKLDLSPISSISDANYWKTADQFDAFVSGIHSRFRSHTTAFQLLGEMRADIFGTEAGYPNFPGTFTGEATQGVERLWLHNLDLDNPGVSNYGGFYTNIVQINLLIEKLTTTNVVTTTNKNYYLGIAYGMRAFYYFQILRTWGPAVIQTDPVTSIDISNLPKAQSSEADVMALIKSDIDKSVTSFGSDYSFRNTKSFWSKAASLMLKAEVFLWTSYRGGGNGDATTALTALTEIQTNIPSLALVSNYANVFSTTSRGNSEMIFVCRNLLNESSIPFISGSFVPQTALLANFHDSVGARQFSVATDNWGGLLRAPVKPSAFRKFHDKDSRKWASIQPAYSRPSPGVYVLAGTFASKFSGEQSAGVRSYTNDYPIYRYADLLLMIAEAKVILGQSPTTEMNLVRARAFGANYVGATFGYPNQPIDASPANAILQERLFEFVFEGKRWYDLRRFGNSFVFANTSLPSSDAYKLLWPVDRNSWINNRALVQTPGYPPF
jgi:starch-binding outer membrane protein, SusD/RagB family